ncbi:MAG: hypothetical protein ACHQF0_01935 [Chitinophagales bacterium]
MALNDIKLNSTVLIGMYRNSLLEITGKQEVKDHVFDDKPKIEENDALTKQWKFLGDFKKKILLIVRYKDATYLPDKQLNFLITILKACKISLGDVAILNIMDAPSVKYKDVQEKFESSFTILLGLTPLELEMPVNFPEFQVQSLNNCTFLHTPSLEKLETDNILKSKLWVCLRRMFSLS